MSSGEDSYVTAMDIRLFVEDGFNLSEHHSQSI